jgi:hypothetical protein
VTTIAAKSASTAGAVKPMMRIWEQRKSPDSLVRSRRSFATAGSYNHKAQQTREIGVRVALGARGGQIARMVMGKALRLTLAGALLGVVGAGIAGRWIASCCSAFSRSIR